MTIANIFVLRYAYDGNRIVFWVQRQKSIITNLQQLKEECKSLNAIIISTMNPQVLIDIEGKVKEKIFQLFAKYS